jgi:hypothetical protein
MFGQLRFHPGDVLVGATGVDDDAEPGFVEEVDDQVVHHAAAFVQHAAVQGLAGGLQLVDVVGDQFLQEVTRALAFQIDRQHVRHIEHAGVAPHDMVFLDLRTVMDRHFPAGKIHQFGVGFAVFVASAGSVSDQPCWTSSA